MAGFTCDYYPNCDLCANSSKCPLMEYTPKEPIIKLIKWELDYRQHHNKDINITDIINWYNKRYYCNVTETDLF